MTLWIRKRKHGFLEIFRLEVCRSISLRLDSPLFQSVTEEHRRTCTSGCFWIVSSLGIRTSAPQADDVYFWVVNRSGQRCWAKPSKRWGKNPQGNHPTMSRRARRALAMAIHYS